MELEKTPEPTILRKVYDDVQPSVLPVLSLSLSDERNKASLNSGAICWETAVTALGKTVTVNCV